MSSSRRLSTSDFLKVEQATKSNDAWCRAFRWTNMSDDIVIRTESVINATSLCTIYHCTFTHLPTGSLDAQRKHIIPLGLLTTYVLLSLFRIISFHCQIALPCTGFAPSHPSSHTPSGLTHSSSSAYFTHSVNVSTGPIPPVALHFQV